MVYVLGSINIDLVAFSKNAPEPGETVVGETFLMNQGGKGANQAIAAAKSGAEVTFIGRVGDDMFGKLAITEVEKYGVKCLVSVDKDVSTGIALIIVESSGENRIVIIPGANGRVSEVELSKLNERITPEDILLLQGEIPIEVIFQAAKVANEKGAYVIFDPAPVKRGFSDILPFATYVTPNEVEIKGLAGESGSISDILEKGAKSVILKKGSEGVIFKDGRTEFSVRSFKVNAVDTTGAGDTFNGAFAAALEMGFEIRKAIAFASAAAAISVTRKGAAISSPYKEEIERFLEESHAQFDY